MENTVNKLGMFLQKAKKTHGDKYGYSLVEYRNNKTKIKIICPNHGVFEQTPAIHTKGSGCRECSYESKALNTEEFIKKVKLIHGDKYDYSLVNYKNCETYIEIICPIHGKFKQKAGNHLKGNGCKKCSIDNRRKDNDQFITEAKKTHGDKYDYSLAKYVNNKGMIKIICPIHGVFEIRADKHIQGIGCRECYIDSLYNDNIKFIRKANEVHNFKYTYDKCFYKRAHDFVIITCKIHGDFKQKAYGHLAGQGCPLCNYSKGEKLIAEYLENNNIDYRPQYHFKGCKNKRVLLFDFYLPTFNTCIEYDGQQHFEKILAWGGEKRLKYIQNNDKIKNEYCKKNNIRLIRIKFNENIEVRLKEI